MCTWSSCDYSDRNTETAPSVVFGFDFEWKFRGFQNMNSICSLSSLNQVNSDLFTNKSTFREVLNYELWKNCFSESKRRELLDKYMPLNLSEDEKEETVKHLLDNDLTRFDANPMDSIYFQLKIQRLSPDLIKVLEDVKQLKLKAQKLQEQQNQCKLFREVITKRRYLFEDAVNSPPDCVLRGSKYARTSADCNSNKTQRKKLILRCQRVKERYLKELKEVKEAIFTAEDEKTLSSADDDDFFELLDDEESVYAESSLCSSINLASPNIYSIPEPNYLRMLKKHKRKRKQLEDSKCDDFRMNTSSITLNGVIVRVSNASEEEKDIGIGNAATDIKLSSPSVKAPKLSPNNCGSVQTAKKKNRTINHKVVASSVAPITENGKKMDVDFTCVKKEPIDIFDFDNDSPPQLFPPPPLTLTSCAVTTTAPVTTLSTIIPQPQSPIIAAPLPALPPLLPSTPEPPPPPPVPLEKAPPCFFSLLRDTFYVNSPNDFKLTLHKLEELIKEKLRCYDPKIGWSHEMVQSAMNYLSGVLPPPEMVPLVDYKEKNQQWQWIGVDRDNDDVLKALCKEWMEEKDKNTSTSLMDPSQPIPPPICPTDWIVKPSSEDEKKIYRDQEALRYNNPHKAFTFRVHGYESVVGPVKGCGIGGINSHSSSPNKAREHSLLVSDRPPFVTLLSLVRDAAARLPNGEGTRADICELLKDSQYLLPTVSDQQVNGIVSGALDRLHYEKDPCVKYDVNRKVWIYLHRNRSEQEFERLHEVQVAAAKAKRSLNKSQRRISSTTNTPKTPAFVGKQTNAKLQKLNTVNPPPITDVPNSISTTNAVIQVPVSVSAVITSSINVTSVSTTNFAVTTYSNLTTNISSTITTDSLQMSKPKLASVLPILSKKKPQKFKIIRKPGDEKGENDCSTTVPTNIALSNIHSVAALPSMAVTTLPISTPSKIEVSEPPSVTCGVTSIVTTKTLTNKTKPVRQTKPIQKPTLALNSLSQKSELQTSSENIHHLLSIAATALPKTNTQIAVPSGTKITVPKQTVATPHIQHIQQQITVPKQLHLQNQPNVTSPGTHQISIPTSVLFGARPGSVVLATAAKSYMMAGGSIVLQPQGPTSTMATSATTSTGSQPSTPLAVRTLPIRVIPVTSGINAQRNATPIIAQSHSQGQGSSGPTPQHHVVARIITTGQPGRGGVPQTQIVIPSTSAFQPLLLAQASNVTTASSNQTVQTPIQVSPAPILQSSQISLPVQQQIKASIELPTQKQSSK